MESGNVRDKVKILFLFFVSFTKNTSKRTRLCHNMVMRKLESKEAMASDMEQCLVIYNYYILNSTFTLEEEPLSLDAFCARFEKIKEKYPYIVLKEGEKVLGYAYLSFFNERSGYRETVDLSIYIDKDYQKEGFGSLLLEKIEEEAKKRGFHNIISIVTGENAPSAHFHEKHGFHLEGRLQGIAKKFGRTLDVFYFRKGL